MKNMLMMVLFLAFTLLLVGCGSKSYQVQTKGGDTYLAEDAPEYDKKSDSYIFEDVNGNEVILNKDDVKVIQQYED